MVIRKLLTLALLITVSCPLALAQGALTNKNFIFNKPAFEQSLTSAVGPNVMGYQFVLIKDGRVVSAKAGGKARTGKDGEREMTVNTPINIGSLAKFMTGTTLLHLLIHTSEWAGKPNYNYVLEGLDSKIAATFPRVWRDNMNQDINLITLRQLLQHRSGFDNDYNKENAGHRDLFDYLQHGFLLTQLDRFEYANVNFVLAGYLVPLYDKGWKELRDHLNESAPKETAAADAYVRKELGQRMLDIFRTRVWDKLSPKFKPSCDAKNEMWNTAAYGYSSKTDTKGVISSAVETQGHCSGEGGYYMSAMDYANYIAHFSSTDIIVDKRTRDLMYTDGMNPYDRLIWAGATDKQWKSYDWFEKNFKMGTMVWSAGGTNGTNGVLLRLPQNYYLVLLVNSNDFEVNELFNFGANAFMAATKDNFK